MQDTVRLQGESRGALHRSTLAEEIADLVAADVLTGRLQAGEELSSVDLAAQWNVSRTPVRDALRILDGRGLVTCRSGAKATVNPLTIQVISDVYALRRLIEGWLTARAVEGIGQNLAGALREDLLRTEALVDSPHEYFAATMKYRKSLYEHASSAIGVELVTWLRNRLHSIPSYLEGDSGYIDTSVARHRELQGMIEAGDSEGARRAVEQLLETACLHFTRAVESRRSGGTAVHGNIDAVRGD